MNLERQRLEAEKQYILQRRRAIDGFVQEQLERRRNAREKTPWNTNQS